MLWDNDFSGAMEIAGRKRPRGGRRRSTQREAGAMVRTFLVCIVFCLVGGTAGAQTGGSGTGSGVHYSNEEYDFTLELPGTWQKLPKELIESMQSGLLEPRDESMHLEVLTGFGSARPGLQPIALVCLCVGYYSDRRQMSDREIRRGVKELMGIDIDKIKEASRGGGEGLSHLKAIRTLSAEYKDERRMLIWECEIDVGGVGTLKGRHLVFFGRQSWVLVYGFALPQKYAECERAIGMIEETFAFGPSAQYLKVEWFESQAFAWALIVVASSVIALVLRKR
jgi:hypothetical protein